MEAKLTSSPANKKISNQYSLINKSIPSYVLEVIRKLQQYDFQAYMVGGCIRDLLLNIQPKDFDIATNAHPDQVTAIFKNSRIIGRRFKIVHVRIDRQIIEVSTFRKKPSEVNKLRNGVVQDNAFGTIEEDAQRRDFTMNAIFYDPINNHLFDPFNGKKDLEDGYINFIGNAEKRIQEDYLRILRYLRFYLNYSNHEHQPEIIKNIKKNIDGISNISSERLIDELKKITSSNGFLKLFKDKESLELIEIIFPQLKNIKNFKKQNSYAAENFLKIDFIFLIALLVIDGTDNADYFLYKFKISNKDKKRLKLIDLFYREKVTLNNFTEKNLNKFFYFNGRQAVLDIINFKIFISNKVEKKLIKLLDTYKEKVIPTLPIGADLLMSKFQIPEGKTLGNKLKRIEETWVQNGFQISDKQVQQIVKS